MSSGVNRVAVKGFYGASADLNVDTVGFKPKLVRIVNVASGGKCRFEWFRGMADDSAIKTVTNGTISVVTSNGITPRTNGFAFGADSDMNVTGELCYYEAHE